MARIASADALLDEAYKAVKNGDVDRGMRGLATELCWLRRSLGAEHWRRYAQTTCREHPLAVLARQGPLTARAFAKPRGYAGDAVMLDLVYTPATLPSSAPALASELYRWEFGLRSAKSVRARRDLLAAEIDASAAAIDRPRVLSIACGHLREAQCSGAVAAGRIGTFLALDQDLTSLALVHAEQARSGVKAVHGSVRKLLNGTIAFTDLDLIYTAGLYDYLPDAVAAELTRVLFAMLTSGGRLIVANFAHGLADQAYMEAFMDWHLIYRDEPDLLGVAARLPACEIAAQRLLRDCEEQVVYLELVRA